MSGESIVSFQYNISFKLKSQNVGRIADITQYCFVNINISKLEFHKLKKC